MLNRCVRVAGRVSKWGDGDLCEVGHCGQSAPPGAGHMEGNRGEPPAAGPCHGFSLRWGRSAACATDIAAGAPSRCCRAAGAFGAGDCSVPAAPSQQPKLLRRGRALPENADHWGLG